MFVINPIFIMNSNSKNSNNNTNKYYKWYQLETK